MRLKRDSVLIVEAISAEDIGKLPDNSIAESLVRLPGLAGQRLNGCQQVISIRGLAPDFSTALLNGRQQVSAGDNRGVEFDQYPSELLSGMAGARGVLFPDSSGGLPAAETTLAEALQARDYATGLVGKWHLGHLPKFLPTRHGFDRFFGLLYSNDMRPENEHWDYARENFPPLPLFDGEAAIEQSPDQALLTRRFTAKAIEFIERHQARPFFLHLAYTAPLGPRRKHAGFLRQRQRPLGLAGAGRRLRRLAARRQGQPLGGRLQSAGQRLHRGGSQRLGSFPHPHQPVRRWLGGSCRPGRRQPAADPDQRAGGPR